MLMICPPQIFNGSGVLIVVRRESLYFQINNNLQVISRTLIQAEQSEAKQMDELIDGWLILATVKNAPEPKPPPKDHTPRDAVRAGAAMNTPEYAVSPR